MKHLNDPRDEHEATYTGQPMGGSVGLDYQATLIQKVEYLANDAKTKFAQYHANRNDDSSAPNKLYLFFTKSTEASVVDIASETLSQFDGQKARTMEECIEDIAQPLLTGTNTTLIVRELFAALA